MKDDIPAEEPKKPAPKPGLRTMFLSPLIRVLIPAVLTFITYLILSRFFGK